MDEAAGHTATDSFGQRGGLVAQLVPRHRNESLKSLAGHRALTPPTPSPVATGEGEQFGFACIPFSAEQILADGHGVADGDANATDAAEHQASTPSAVFVLPKTETLGTRFTPVTVICQPSPAATSRSATSGAADSASV